MFGDRCLIDLECIRLNLFGIITSTLSYFVDEITIFVKTSVIICIVSVRLNMRPLDINNKVYDMVCN